MNVYTFFIIYSTQVPLNSEKIPLIMADWFFSA